MTILADWQIKELALSGMITPFEPTMIRQIEKPNEWTKVYERDESWNMALTETIVHKTSVMKVISYGLGSYGYDLRLSPKQFDVFRHIPGTVVDPKNFNKDNLEPVELDSDENGEFFIIPAHSYGLGVAIEYLDLPRNVTVIFIGKSTYARCGVIANVTPGEAGWYGHLTLEFSNSSSADTRIYANEGVIQAVFFQGAPCQTSYGDRAGKYQGQAEEVTIARV